MSHDKAIVLMSGTALLILFASAVSLALPSTCVIAQEPLLPTAFPPREPPELAQGHEHGLTLPECYALARKRSEALAIQQEQIAIAESRFTQAFSGALPRLSFSSSDKRQDATGDSDFTLRTVPERKFTLIQPLFGGFKEFAAMAGANAERRQRNEELMRAGQLLFGDVANALYLALEQRDDLEALKAIRIALSNRIDELKDREQLGRSRASEVASADTALRRIEAEIELIRGRAIASRQLLEFLTGLPRVDALADSAQPLPLLASQETYLNHADVRPDVRADEEAWRVAQRQVAIAKGGLWPTARLEGNYYAERAGVLKDTTWDALLLIDVPIFQGGKGAGAVKEAKARERAAKLLFDQTKRKAILDIRNSYTNLQAALTRRAALQQARQAAETNYQLQTDDYQKSLISNLDLLQALQQLQDARREMIHATYEAKRLYWQLRIAAGETL